MGVLAVLYGAAWAFTTAASWTQLQPPGTTIGPPSLVQAMTLSIEQGVLLAAFGSVLAASGFAVTLRHAREPSRLARGTPAARRALALFLGAVLLLVAVFASTLVAPPERVLTFQASDFQLAPASADGPYEIYYVSIPFAGTQGEVANAYMRIALVDNRTGAVVDQENFSSDYVKGVSDPYAHPAFGQGWVLAATGSYVVVVRNDFCEALARPPCANATFQATGEVWITTTTAFIPYQVGLGIVSCAMAVGGAVQSGLGRRRATS